MAHFARALHDLGRLLIDRYDGSFEALVRAANGSAEGFVALLLEMPTRPSLATGREASTTTENGVVGSSAAGDGYCSKTSSLTLTSSSSAVRSRSRASFRSLRKRSRNATAVVFTIWVGPFSVAPRRSGFSVVAKLPP